MSHSYNRKEK